MNKKGSVNEKHLLVGLFCLLVIIVGLVVTIVVVNGRDRMSGCESAADADCVSDGDGGTRSDSEEIVLTDEEQAMVDAAQEEMEKWDEGYKSFEDDVVKIRNEAKKYLEQNTVDFDAIHKLYSEYEEKYKQSGNLSLVASLMFDERNLFLESGKQTEALHGLTLNDYTIFAEWEQHDYYAEVLELANELGDENTIAKYRPLFDATQAAWDDNMNKIENATTE